MNAILKAMVVVEAVKAMAATVSTIFFRGGAFITVALGPLLSLLYFSGRTQRVRDDFAANSSSLLCRPSQAAR